MSAPIIELGTLRAPIAADHPCGADLEDSPVLGRFNAYRVFGRDSAWEEAEEQPDWAEMRSEALATLGTSKDLRFLSHLAAASLRTDGLAAFCSILDLAADWLEQFWDSLHPGLDEEGLFRRNALACFADRIAIIDALRRVALVSSRQHGTFSLRDLDLARGHTAPPPDAPIPQEAEIAAAFAEIGLPDLTALHSNVGAAVQAVKRIEVKTTEAVGPAGTPDLLPLAKNLARIHKVLGDAQASHPAAQTTGTDANAAGDLSAPRTAATLGAVRSRQDAIRALDAVAKFFSENEPSSPVPLFVERAKRLVAKNFLEILADVVPDAVTQARNVGGLRE